MDPPEIKGFKKKKVDGLTMDNIDNTAPVKKILDDLEGTNPQAFQFLKHNRQPRYYHRVTMTNKHYLMPGHQLAAFPDDWEGDLSPDYFQAFPYKSMMPKMITAMANHLRKDPLTEFLQLKEDWFTELMNQKHSNVIYKVPLVYKITEHSDEVLSCPKHLVDMAKHMESDPDPYFSSPYNWYYAGNGNMQRVYVNQKEYLMCCEFHFCYLFEFNRAELTYNRDTATVFDCGESNNICEGICSTRDVIALRTKHKVFVLKIVVADDKLEIQKLKVSESIKPYTGISFDDHHKNILYVTDLNNQLKIVNLDRLTARTVELKNSVTSLVNNWNTVVGNERGYYAHVAGNAVTLYDKRINCSVRRWSNPNRVADHAWCNTISAAQYSPRGPYLYLATNHHLLSMDMRYQKNFALRPVQRWTHGMKCFPAYMSICDFENDRELVCLSSQWCEDTCVVPNHTRTESGEPQFRGASVPYRLPSVLQTLSDARLQALCADVYSPVENRLVTALTGSVLLRHGDGYVVLSQNGLGDVTAHVLHPERTWPLVQEDGPRALHEWARDYRLEESDLVVSGVWDISDLWKYLARVPDGAINRRYENQKSHFDEREVLDAFENGELDDGLLDVWLDDGAAGPDAGARAGGPDRPEDESELSLSFDIETETR